MTTWTQQFVKEPITGSWRCRRAKLACSAPNTSLRSRELARWLHSDLNLYTQSPTCSWLYQPCVTEDIINRNRRFQLALTTALWKLPLHIAQASAGSPVISLVLLWVSAGLMHTTIHPLVFKARYFILGGSNGCRRGDSRGTILILNCFFLVPETHHSASQSAVCAQGMSLDSNFLKKGTKTQQWNNWLSPGTPFSSPLWSLSTGGQEVQLKGPGCLR